MEIEARILSKEGVAEATEHARSSLYEAQVLRDILLMLQSKKSSGNDCEESRAAWAEVLMNILEEKLQSAYDSLDTMDNYFITKQKVDPELEPEKSPKPN
jgi:hypothetical protein